MHTSKDEENRSRSPEIRSDESGTEVRSRTPLGTSDANHSGDTSGDEPELLSLPAGAQDLNSSSEMAAKKPKMPYFLQLSDMDIARKFNELNLREKFRIDHGLSNPASEWATCNSPELVVLDRYLNIQPWASNRSKLLVPEGKNDYINASPICLQQPHSKSTDNYKYITMQGPKENTISHTWRLVWEQVESPGVIVMLTDLEEGGKEKCYPYFPIDADSSPLVINDPDEFGDGFKATVHFSEREETEQGDAIEARKLMIRVEMPVKGDPEKDEEDTVKVEEKIIWHLLYTRWPDFGVPAVTEVESFFALMKMSRAKNSVPGNSRIVHCSAGVGRSGTFIALEYLMAELEAGAMVYYGNRDIPRPKPKGTNHKTNIQSGSPAHQAAIAAKENDIVFETVDLLRQQRKAMVQADSQFHFIYRVLRRCWEVKYKGADSEPTKPEIRQIDGSSS